MGVLLCFIKRLSFNIHFFLIDYILLNELNLKHYYSDDGADYKYNCYFKYNCYYNCLCYYCFCHYYYRGDRLCPARNFPRRSSVVVIPPMQVCPGKKTKNVLHFHI